MVGLYAWCELPGSLSEMLGVEAMLLMITGMKRKRSCVDGKEGDDEASEGERVGVKNGLGGKKWQASCHVCEKMSLLPLTCQCHMIG